MQSKTKKVRKEAQTYFIHMYSIAHPKQNSIKLIVPCNKVLNVYFYQEFHCKCISLPRVLVNVLFFYPEFQSMCKSLGNDIHLDMELW